MSVVRVLGFLATAMALVGSLSCAPAMLMGSQPLNKGTIELWRDKDNTCRTHTTPYVKVKKGAESKVEWKIVDDVECTTNQDVIIRFDKKATDPVSGCDKGTDPLPSCDKKGKRKIECTLETTYGNFCYNVYIGDQVEDPELEIERP